MADKPKRKGLMSLLTEYQNENNKSGLTKDGDSRSDIAEARRRQAKVKAQASKPKPKPAAKKTTPAKKTTSNPTPAKKTPLPKRPAMPSSAQSNKDGTYGKSMPSNPKVGITMAPRKKRPGTGRTGEAAAKAANRSTKGSSHKETMTAAKKRAMRLKARRGR